MKKVLKIIGLLILAVIAFVLIAGLFIDKDFHFERSITINAPQQTVWQHVGSLKAMDPWNPFDDKDPAIQKEFSGTDGTVGSSYHWKGNSQVGEGSETIAKIDAPNRVDIKLDFIKPFEGHSDAYFLLAPDGAGTRVTWGFDNHAVYPLNAVMKFMGMESAMNDEFNKGLQQLKQLVEGK